MMMMMMMMTEYFLRKSALHKHYFNIEEIGLAGTIYYEEYIAYGML